MGQGVHAATEFAVGDAVKVPTPHGTQAVEPGSAQLPSGQHTVVAGALRVVPLPAQGVQDVALKAELKVSAEHGAQAMAPVVASRSHAVPSGQGKHPGASPLTKPGAQQLAQPGAEKRPAPHAAQEVG